MSVMADGSAACAEACSGSSVDSMLRALADVGTGIFCIALWLLFVAINARLAGYVWRGWLDSCGCSKCVMRAPLRAMLAVLVNMLFPIANAVFLPSSSTSARTSVTALTFVAAVVVLAYMLASIYTLLNPRDRHNQPCLLETNTQDSGDNAADVMAQLEEQPLITGVAWEVELSSALLKGR